MSAVRNIRNGQGDRRSRSLAVWSWLRNAWLRAASGIRCDAKVSSISTSMVIDAMPGRGGSAEMRHDAAKMRGGTNALAEAGIVLPFPIHGEALLVKLAEVLRARIADCGPEWNPLLPQLSRRPWSRLSIDHQAHVEFLEHRGEYRAVIDAQLGTKVIVETAEFDVVVDFVLQYVTGRLAEPAELEAAS
jgi:NAD(P)H-hydrate repair Nnr-like enzyme with NAD(P)H-hydrate epimerase domain